MLPTGLIDSVPQEGVRRIALSLLEDAQAACRRLADASDTEALHDFRVALRRLRSTLSAYRHELSGSVSGKRRRQVRELADATGMARDSEVQLVWLEAQRDKLPERHQPAVSWLSARLKARARAAYRRVRGPVRQRFEQLAPKLIASLSTYTGSLDGLRSESFAAAASERIREAAAALHEALAETGGVDDVEAAHRARIRAKRLRYLLEPLRNNTRADASAAVETLKALQDVLGELHDSQVLAAGLAQALVRASAESARRAHAAVYGRAGVPRPRTAVRQRNMRAGLLAIDRLNRERRDLLYRALERDWLHGRDRELLRQADALVASLAAQGGANVEIERKYLLRALPEAARTAPVDVIEQGWIPGRKLQERLRHTVSASGERFYRCIKQGAGLRRSELEEETTEVLFKRLWPLTEGRRIRKRRYKIPDGELTWELDEFLDRDLVLAEVELTDDQEPPIPGWLAPVLVHEVTGDPRYLNWSLAGACQGESQGTADGRKSLAAARRDSGAREKRGSLVSRRHRAQPRPKGHSSAAALPRPGGKAHPPP